MKLWLDDVRTPPEGWIWAKTYKEAIAHLEAGGVEAVSFDHDLGLGKSGYDLATWIEERAMAGTVKRLKWMVHSKNPVGSRRIQSVMESAERFWEWGRLRVIREGGKG